MENLLKMNWDRKRVFSSGGEMLACVQPYEVEDGVVEVVFRDNKAYALWDSGNECHADLPFVIDFLKDLKEQLKTSNVTVETLAGDDDCMVLDTDESFEMLGFNPDQAEDVRQRIVDTSQYFMPIDIPVN